MRAVVTIAALCTLVTSLALFSARASASEVPNVDDVTTVPELFPNPFDLPVKGLAEQEKPMTEVDVATEILWGSILRNEKENATIVRALDGIKVLVSGAIEIDGIEQLYLGIYEKDFNKHDIKHLYRTLKEQFPNVPIYIEASKGVDLLQDSPNEETPVNIFSDDFNTLERWAKGLSFSSEWQTDTFDTYPVPGEGDDNRVAIAHSADCVGECVITTKPIDLSNYTSVTLSLHRWIDDALDAGDFLAIEIGNNNEYHRLATWDEGDGDDVWRYKTYDLDEEHLGTHTTIRFIASPGGSIGSIFDFFSGGNSAKEKILAIDNVTIAGIPKPITLHTPSVGISPATAMSGDTITIRATVQNTGTTTATTKNVQVYRTTVLTSNPTSGVLVSSTATGTINAKAQKTVTIQTIAPTVATETTYYYYACVANSCASFARSVTVQPKREIPVQDPKEPARDISLGGDRGGSFRINKTTPFSTSTITLGGLETKDGTKGFVVSSHAAVAGNSTFENYTKPNATDVVFKNVSERLLGKVAVLPHLITHPNGLHTLTVDAAFVAYPTALIANCSLLWESSGESFCLDIGRGNQIERVKPLTIRGKENSVYTVIGSQPVTEGLDVWSTGATSGPVAIGRTRAKKKLILGIKSDLHFLVNVVPSGSLRPGDSGGPIYTTPDAQGNTHIVGILRGSIGIAGERALTFSPWEDVTEGLNLKSID